MTPIRDLVYTPLYFIMSIFALLIFFLQIWNMIEAGFTHKERGAILPSLLHVILGFFFTSILLSAKMMKEHSHPRYISPLLKELTDLPWILYVVFLLFSLVFLTLNEYRRRNYFTNYLTRDSVKEALDLLPPGIAFGNDNGEPILVNLRMNQLSRMESGTTVKDTRAFWKILSSKGQEENGQILLNAKDGITYLITKDSIMIDGKPYDQILSADMTDEYRVTQELEGMHKRLREMQIRMNAMQSLQQDMIISEEILKARTTIHDEVGNILLTGKYYFDHPENMDPSALLRIYREANELLIREAEEDDTVRDYVRDAQQMADAIGVVIRTEGEIPNSGIRREILGRAMYECAANTAKHAEGDLLTVRILPSEEGNAASGITCLLTNNGNPPAHEIVEAGGLKSLRCIVENAGGRMTVESSPRFTLTLRLP